MRALLLFALVAVVCFLLGRLLGPVVCPSASKGSAYYHYLSPPGCNEAAVLPDAPKAGKLALPGPTSCQFATYTSSQQWWLDTLVGGGAPLLAAGPAVQPLRCTASYTRVGHCGSEFAETEAGQLSYVVFRTDTRASLTRVEIADITATGVVRTDPKRHGEGEIDLEAIVWDFAKEPGPYALGSFLRPSNARRLALISNDDASPNGFHWRSAEGRAPLLLHEHTWQASGTPKRWDGAPYQLLPNQLYAVGVLLHTRVSRSRSRADLVADFSGSSEEPAGVTVGEITIHYGPPASPLPCE